MFDILSRDEITEVVWQHHLKLPNKTITEAVAKAEQKHTLKQVIERGNEVCTNDPLYARLRHNCEHCWAELEKEG